MRIVKINSEEISKVWRLPDDVARSIERAVQGLEYGSVEIIVHNSSVVQIERHERIRLPTQSRNNGSPERIPKV